MLHAFEQAVRRMIAVHALFPERGMVVVACSGGADSLALLYALHALVGRPGRAFPEVWLHVAHLDHGLRGDAGAADRTFVAETAASLGLPFTGATVTPAEHARWRGSGEAAARTARYAFLGRVARSVGAERIALGHTADDQAETILFHLIRGSGIEGMAGMQPRSGERIRPLLDRWRDETEAYCAAHNLTPRTDSTNLDARYTRNRIRHEVIPLLESIHPGVRRTLARNATIFAETSAWLRAATQEAWLRIAYDPQRLGDLTSRDDEAAEGATIRRRLHAAGWSGEHLPMPIVVLDRGALRTVAPALRQRVLRHALSMAGADDPSAQIDTDDVTRLGRVAGDARGGLRLVEFANRIVVIVARSTIAVYALHQAVKDTADSPAPHNPSPEATA